MREYGQIQSAFWHSADCQAFTDIGKLLAAYLMTGPHTNGVGCFRVGPGAMADDLKWSIERFDEGFKELAKQSFAFYIDGVVLMPKFLYWNRIANENVAKARFSEWEQVPKGQAKAFAARSMLEFCQRWPDAMRVQLETACKTVEGTVPVTQFSEEKTRTQPERTLSLSIANAISSANDEKSTTEETDPPPRPIKPPGRRVVPPAKHRDEPAGFAEFYALYPRKEGRPKAAAAFGKLTVDQQRLATKAIVEFAASWKWQSEPDFIPHPTTWLNQHRFNDTPPPRQRPVHQQQPIRQSRQAAIIEAIANDQRYADTAARHALAIGSDPQGLPALDGAFAVVSAGSGRDPGND